MTKVLSFDKAIADSERYTKRHLILGNGFSIACQPHVFSYNSLFDKAKISNNPRLSKIFQALETQDFEVAIKHLESGARIVPTYNSSPSTISRDMAADAQKLKEILLSTIAKNHPDTPLNLSTKQISACRHFLSHFIGEDVAGQIFTLNYDLLLYWVLMHRDSEFVAHIPLALNDGFGNDEDDPEAEYVVWQGETGAHSARIHFLHGALHLFDAGNDLKKFTWVRTNERLTDQARTAIGEGMFPLFVAEGSSAQKKNKIRHNAYLYQGFKQLTANAAQRNHCFFVHGHSLARNDDHILKRLGRGKCKHLYISIFGDPMSKDNKSIINRAKDLAAVRSAYYPLELTFYDAESASVWGAD